MSVARETRPMRERPSRLERYARCETVFVTSSSSLITSRVERVYGVFVSVRPASAERDDDARVVTESDAMDADEVRDVVVDVERLVDDAGRFVDEATRRRTSRHRSSVDDETVLEDAPAVDETRLLEDDAGIERTVAFLNDLVERRGLSRGDAWVCACRRSWRRRESALAARDTENDVETTRRRGRRRRRVTWTFYVPFVARCSLG